MKTQVKTGYSPIRYTVLAILAIIFAAVAICILIAFFGFIVAPFLPHKHQSQPPPIPS